MSIQRVAILGSTGSIGINTLKVIERFPKKFKVVGLTAFKNTKLLEEQIRKFSPTHVAVAPSGIRSLRKTFSHKKIKVLDVTSDEMTEIVKLSSVDIVVIGMRGSAALVPFLEAVRSGKRVAPANKEALVIAGDIIMREAKKHKATIIPVDSEQSAIFQCLDGQKNRFKKIYLTASGGPLHDMPPRRFAGLSVREILRHPRWKMGRKITVDSATLMNKGFEIIETKRLFDVQVDDIKVLIHPEAIVHSMVEFCDGSILAQLGITDMRLPIQYALTYPQRVETGLKDMDFYRLGRLTFARPDMKKFPALRLAIDVARKGGTFPCVLNAADEQAVEAFLNGKIGFLKIQEIVEKVVRLHRGVCDPDLEDIFEADQSAREDARRIISKSN
jgi:1-deoxy-D-xylulose-5-phosphate reductoisomerase